MLHAIKYMFVDVMWPTVSTTEHSAITLVIQEKSTRDISKV